MSRGNFPSFGNANQMNKQLLKMLQAAEDIIAFAIHQKMNDH